MSVCPVLPPGDQAGDVCFCVCDPLFVYFQMLLFLCFYPGVCVCVFFFFFFFFLIDPDGVSGEKILVLFYGSVVFYLFILLFISK